MKTYFVLVISGALCASNVVASELPLADAERRAIEGDMSLARIAAMADATAEGAIADGALPDPEIFVGIQNLPARSFSMNDDMMTMSMVGVRQQFPPGRTRMLARARSETMAVAQLSDLTHRELEIRRAVRMAWLDWRLAHESLAIARAAEDEFKNLLEVIEQRFAAGTSQQRDVSQARLELAGLSERILNLSLNADASAARLARWLDRAIGPEEYPGDGPAWPTPDIDQIASGLPAHPVLTASEHRVQASQIGADMARQAYRPMWMAEAGYGLRSGNRSDMVSIMVSVSLPLFTADRQDRRLAAAQRTHDAARYGHADRIRELSGALNEQFARWQRLSEVLDLYRTDLVPDAIAVRTDTFTAYRNNRATFDELARAHLAELGVRTRELLVARQRDDARIELMFLSGE